MSETPRGSPIELNREAWAKLEPIELSGAWTASDAPFRWSIIRACQRPVFACGMKNSRVVPTEAIAAPGKTTGFRSVAVTRSGRERAASLPLLSCGASSTDDHAPEPQRVHQHFIPTVGLRHGLALAYAWDVMSSAQLTSVLMEAGKS